jgi:hypothetical protein
MSKYSLTRSQERGSLGDVRDMRQQVLMLASVIRHGAVGLRSGVRSVLERTVRGGVPWMVDGFLKQFESHC